MKTSGTKISILAVFWLSLTIAKNHQKVPFFQNFFFATKFNKFPFERRVPIALTPHGYLCGSPAVFEKTAEMGGKYWLQPLKFFEILQFFLIFV